MGSKIHKYIVRLCNAGGVAGAVGGHAHTLTLALCETEMNNPRKREGRIFMNIKVSCSLFLTTI